MGSGNMKLIFSLEYLDIGIVFVFDFFLNIVGGL